MTPNNFWIWWEGEEKERKVGREGESRKEEGLSTYRVKEVSLLSERYYSILLDT